MARAVLAMLGLRRRQVSTLIEEFRYPRLGPGQMWETFQRHVEERDIAVHLNHRCVSVRHEENHVTSVVVRSNGDEAEYDVDGVVSSIPLSDIVLSLKPA